VECRDYIRGGRYLAISSWNKRATHVRIRIKKTEMKSWSPDAGIHILQYPPQTPFTQMITHANGLTSKIDTYSTGIGEMNINASASGCHFIPTERRYKEDIEKALDGMDILTKNVNETNEPRHVNRGINKGLGLEFMEHTTYVDNPTLDAIDHVRSIMTNKRTLFLSESKYKEVERIMMGRPQIFGVPSNAQANPNRFMKEAKGGERDPITGEKTYEAEVGTY